MEVRFSDDCNNVNVATRKQVVNKRLTNMENTGTVSHAGFFRIEIQAIGLFPTKQRSQTHGSGIHFIKCRNIPQAKIVGCN